MGLHEQDCFVEQYKSRIPESPSLEFRGAIDQMMMMIVMMIMKMMIMMMMMMMMMIMMR